MSRIIVEIQYEWFIHEFERNKCVLECFTTVVKFFPLETCCTWFQLEISSPKTLRFH